MQIKRGNTNGQYQQLIKTPYTISFTGCVNSKKDSLFAPNYFLNLDISQNIRITTSTIPIIAVYAPALKMSPTNSQEVSVVDNASATINK